MEPGRDRADHIGMDFGPTHDPAGARERLKALAVRLLLCALLTLVVPGTALLASAVAPDEWLAFQTGLRLLALVSALAGVGATILTFLDAMTVGRRLTRRLTSDDGPRWNAEEPRA